jgi:general secretion pathway protein I
VKSRRGFTLIEVMVASAVLGIAATALFSLLSRSLSNIRTVEDLHHYQLAGQDVMNRVLLLSTLPPGGRFEGTLEPADTRWSVTVHPWIPENFEEKPPNAVVKIDVEVFWPGRAGERSVRLETVRAASLTYSDYDFAAAIQSALPQ